MRIEAMHHRPMSNYAFLTALDELCVRFRTAKKDISEVILHYGVKFDWGNKTYAPMKRVATDQYYDYYEYLIKTSDMRIGYYFEVKDDYSSIYYTEAGVQHEFSDDIAHCLYYQYPSAHTDDLVDAPKWYQEATFYQIFVERFANGDDSISPSNKVAWDSLPTPKSFYGGDIIGITNHLDYLHNLGITAIYLTPIFESESNHKYDTIDYMQIDSHFGTKEDFKTLVQTAHEKGIHIILDAVFNHCSENFALFKDVCEKGAASSYKDWFYIHDFPVRKDPPNYDTFATVGYMPRFRTEHKEVQEYFFSVVEYWTREFGIDGWRLDVSDELSHDFLRKLRNRIKEIDKNLVLVGENWHDSNAWLQGDQFDSVMNYGLTFRTTSFFAKGKLSCQEFTNQLSTLLMSYSDTVNHQMFNLLDSHDTERFLYLAGEDEKKLRNAAAFLYGYVGVPCIFYGTELGLTGGYDPGCRVGFPWDQTKWNQSLLSYFKRLILLRRTQKALLHGNIAFYSTEDIFIAKRTYEDESIYVVINPTNQSLPIPSAVKARYDLIRDGMIGAYLEPESAYYLK